MTKLAALLAATTLALFACHAQRPAARAVATTAAVPIQLQHAPGRADISTDTLPPLVELVRTGYEPCETAPISDPQPSVPRPGTLRMLTRPCVKRPARPERRVTDL